MSIWSSSLNTGEVFSRIRYWTICAASSRRSARTSKRSWWSMTARTTLCAPVGELPAEGFRVLAGKQPERRFEQDDPEEELPDHSAQAMGRCAVVAVLLRGQLWRRADCHHPTVH